MTQTNHDDQHDQAEAQPAAKAPRYQDDGEGAISGNLTRDPELRFTASGQAVTALRVACSQRQRDPDTGQWEDGPTDFYDVTVWRQQACNVAESLATGDRVVVVGRWQIQTWEDNQGAERSKRVLVARDIGASMAYCEVRLRKNQGGRRQ